MLENTGISVYFTKCQHGFICEVDGLVKEKLTRKNRLVKRKTRHTIYTD